VQEKSIPPLSDAALRIVTEFASRENATVDDVLSLARQLPAALGYANSMAVQPDPVPASSTQQSDARPAVDVSQSVSDDSVTCLCCGKSFTMLKRHLKAEHGLTEDEYRARFGLAEDHPLVAPNYSIRKAEYAKRIGLGKYARDENGPQPSRPSA
jgi:predicted transcriptional regulator